MFLECHPVLKRAARSSKSLARLLPLAPQGSGVAAAARLFTLPFDAAARREGICQAGFWIFRRISRAGHLRSGVAARRRRGAIMPPGLKEKMLARYIAHFPISTGKHLKVRWRLCGLRHTRVLAVLRS